MEEKTVGVTSNSGGSSKIEYDQLEDGLSRIIKKQKTSLSKTITEIDTIISSLKTCKQVLSLSDSTDAELTPMDTSNNTSNTRSNNEMVRKAILKLNQSVIDSNIWTKVVNEHKELHAPISKFGKLVDKNFRSDIENSSKDIDFDIDILNNIILHHLYRIGKFEIGDVFAKEIGTSTEFSTSIKEKFRDHHRILSSIDQYNLEPVIEWCKKNNEELGLIDSSLEFKLYKLQFIHLLKNGKQQEALQYARTYLSRLSNTHMKELQHLMGTFAFAHKLENSPYRSMFEEQAFNEHWAEIRSTFSRDNCSLMNIPQDSPLSIAVTVGMKSLPTLLKLSSFSILKGVNDDSLTVEIQVDEKYKFHSIFACPVSREQSTPTNPPVMLQCGHLLCKNSMQRLLKGSSNRFKCPYCPTEQNLSNVKTVYF
ncbi:hypothetical protein DICPUDRAFT_152146 [Dictyostelium purpureum]|uniref:RING-Gid-type domain-containing protein n=1 Tax=Dictyostelium purpureum TaxID=5786 RepID=F0ZKK8_DICPU|nr:uncharacterized protein DICPUDRAFT_152146 [Dictyostelium purpureum]EGC35530.1 hypothetical protein DICPUDRAFT_152146 [Dictyostelium purpureum]|eukprot:XP_003287956.1 hypothetical protein DICPUDRAFT_152146 [Dictyostelium purpureum]